MAPKDKSTSTGASDSDSSVTIRVRKMMKNPLLCRKQCVVDISHPGKASPSKNDLKEKLGKLLKVKDDKCVILYGFKTVYGGNRSTGFALIYDNVEEAKKRDKKSRLIRFGLVDKPTKKGRKGIKETKNKSKLVRGKGNRLAKKKAKRAAE
jgi:small subunit ribosomal protein S24e